MCIASVQALVDDASLLARAGVEGNLSVRADATRHQGDFRKVIEGVNHTLDAVVGPLTLASQCVDHIAQGAVPPEITEEFRGDFEVLKKNLNTCIQTIDAMVADTKRLSAAAVAGRLQVRADAAKHRGDFRDIVQGVNDTLDAIVVPFRSTADYFERISHGDIPPRMSDESHGAVQGDLVTIRASINRCLDALGAMVTDVNDLVRAALDGRLEVRLDTSRHEGAFRAALDGVNRTLDAITAPTRAASTVLERLAQRDLRARVEGDFRGEHARLKERVNATGHALNQALSQVHDVANEVSSAAAQIASSSQAVSSGATEQASSLASTTSSVESLRSMTQRSAVSAQQASALATVVSASAAEGAGAVDQLQGVMGQIKVSAQGTSAIIKDVPRVRRDEVGEVLVHEPEALAGSDRLGEGLDLLSANLLVDVRREQARRELRVVRLFDDVRRGRLDRESVELARRRPVVEPADRPRGDAHRIRRRRDPRRSDQSLGRSCSDHGLSPPTALRHAHRRARVRAAAVRGRRSPQRRRRFGGESGRSQRRRAVARDAIDVHGGILGLVAARETRAACERLLRRRIKRPCPHGRRASTWGQVRTASG